MSGFSRTDAPGETDPEPDFADVIGQTIGARWRLPPRGQRSLIGAPGGGKTMMARRLAGILLRSSSTRRLTARPCIQSRGRFRRARP